MLNALTKPYKGLTREIWYLSFITLVNRAGAMVIPFLSLYLNKHLHFTLDDVGWIMTAFGLGSAAGSFTGGKLTDKFGYLRVMVSSLILTGLIFFGLQFFTQFWHLALGVFTLSLVADTYRPAIWVAMDAYSNESNRTRSVTLIRLAINLGFAVGPAVGGLIIAHIGYSELFWIDGATSIIAGVLLMYLLVQKKKKKGIIPEKQNTPTLSPYRDIPYLIFIIAIAFMGIAFLQFNSTMPIYFNREIGMSEEQIGLLLALNGGLIFLLEMPLVHYIEKLKKPSLSITILGISFFVLSFLALNMAPVIFFPILSMIFLTVGEMISFPFSNTFAMQRAQSGKKGDYMALYTLTFSIGHIFGPNLGMHLTKNFGFQTTWFFMAGIMVLSAGILFFMMQKIALKKHLFL